MMEASVIIAISSPHRKASLDAVQYAIDTLKAAVLIWKKVCFCNTTVSGFPNLTFIAHLWGAYAIPVALSGVRRLCPP